MLLGIVSILIVRKDTETLIKQLEETYEEGCNVQKGALILTRALCLKISDPRKHLQLCYITNEGMKYVDQEQLEKLISVVEAEEAEKMEAEKK